MTREQAEHLVAALQAAWPFPRWPNTTVALYRDMCERLGDYQLAELTIRDAIDNLERPPTIAAIRADYQRRVRRAVAEQRPAELPEPVDVDENLRRIRELTRRFWPEEAA